MSGNIITKLESQYRYLTKVEKKIADLVFEDPEKFTTFTTVKVAKLCNVSQGSVNNFAKKFVPKGFSFLKLEIAMCVTNKQGSSEEKEDGHTEKGVLGIMERKIREHISALCNTLDINEEETLESAAEKIMNAKRIDVYGRFRSSVAAKSYCQKFAEFGIPSCAPNGGVDLAVSASTLDEKDVVIAISSSGSTKAVCDAVTVARKKGAKVICVTSNRFSPLAKMSEDVILTSCGHGRSIDSADKMRMSQLLVADALCAYIRWRYGERGKDSYINLEEILHNAD